MIWPQVFLAKSLPNNNQQNQTKINKEIEFKKFLFKQYYNLFQQQLTQRVLPAQISEQLSSLQIDVEQQESIDQITELTADEFLIKLRLNRYCTKIVSSKQKLF